MQTLHKAVMRSGRTGSILPDVYPVMGSTGIHFRRGATSMIAGAPGAFKSTLALNLLVRWAQEGMTALFISADSDEFTVAKRCAGIITGDPISEIEKTLRGGGYTSVLKQLASVHWEYKPLSIREIDLRMLAFESMYGHFPDLVFIDNLMNMVDSPADFHGQIEMTRDLDSVARAAQSHVMILHHTSEQQDPDVLPPPRHRIQGKVSQFPRLILTLANAGDRLMVGLVKNTNGPQDSSGQLYCDLAINHENARIVEYATE